MGKTLRDLDFDDQMIMAPGRERPTHSVPAPAEASELPRSGKELFAWCKRVSPKRGVDVLQQVKDWGKANHCPPDLFRWTATHVGLCLSGIGETPPAMVRLVNDGSPSEDPVPPSVGSSPPAVPVAAPRPLAVIPHPASGGALLAWALQAGSNLGIDLYQRVQDWGQGHRLSLDVKSWDIGSVTNCMVAISKELDEARLLNIPPEARAQMPQARPPAASEPGPLTIDPRDPLKAKKIEIQETAKRLFRASMKADPTEVAVMEFLRERCAAHGIAVVASIRNCGMIESLKAILKALQEDEREMGLF